MTAIPTLLVLLKTRVGAVASETITCHKSNLFTQVLPQDIKDVKSTHGLKNTSHSSSLLDCPFFNEQQGETDEYFFSHRCLGQDQYQAPGKNRCF